MTEYKLPVDVQKFLFDKYYNWNHKKDSDWAKDLLVKYGCLSERDRRLPADVRWFLVRLTNCDGYEVDEKTMHRAEELLAAYPALGPHD